MPTARAIARKGGAHSPGGRGNVEGLPCVPRSAKISSMASRSSAAPTANDWAINTRSTRSLVRLLVRLAPKVRVYACSFSAIWSSGDGADLGGLDTREGQIVR